MNMNITGVSRVLAVSGIVAGMMGVPAVQASPIEHAVDAAGVSSGYVDLAYGDHTVNASLANNFETDSYHFSATAGDQVRVALHTQTSFLDGWMELLDPMGTRVHLTWCNGTSVLCSTSFDQAIETSGVYTLNVSDASFRNAGDYELHLAQIPPATNWVGLSYSTPVTDTFGHATDMDFWAFNGIAGTKARVVFGGNSGNVDPNVEIWDPSGVKVVERYCANNGCTSSVDLDFGMTGVYKLAVSDASLNEVGDYTLGVSCIYGSCSVTTPTPPIPEPETYALMLAGLSLISFMVRRRV
jgi:hypothetical protein